MRATRSHDELPILPTTPPRAGLAGRVDLDGVAPILPSLLDSIADAMVVVDVHRRVVAANRRYIEAFGSLSDDLAGGVCTEALVCPEAAARAAGHECVACQVLSGHGPQQVIRSIPGSDGRMRRWEATFSPVTCSGGNVTHVVEVWRDITERSQLEAQLGHSERLASLGMLAAGVGHEINNPLASVLACVDSLGRLIQRGELERGGAAEALELVQLLEREVTRCRETTDKLMLLAQPSSAAPSRVNLNRAVEDTVGLLRYQTRKRGVEPVLVLDPDLPAIWAKDSGIRGVCMNLMMNAVQAMAKGGELRVITRQRGSHVELVVEDGGPGIAPEHLERIWDPFFTTKPTGQGTGLGLTVTHAVVSRHGGTIRAENRAEGGARFIVRLPVKGSGGHDPE
jgi:PAS domain S-box-containing protein